MPTKFDIGCTILKRNGFVVKEGNRNEDDFYKLLATETSGRKKSASKLRLEICDFQEQNQFYFQLFLPKLLPQPTISGDPKEKLLSELQLIRKKRQVPFPREVYAASELLQCEIYIFEFTGTNINDVDQLSGVLFSPLLQPASSNQAVLMIMAVDAGKPNFALFKRNSNTTCDTPFPAPVLNLEHKGCHQNRFMNTFHEMFTPRSSDQRSNLKDFFRRLSIEIYGSDQYRDQVKKLICNFQAEECNLDVFSKFLDDREDRSLEARRKLLAAHLDNVEHWRTEPGEGEAFAAANVFNVIIFKDKYMACNWDIYLPLNVNFKQRFNSMIVLREQTDGKYSPYITNPGLCACEQKIPQVLGKIGVIKDNVYKILAHKPCCPALVHHGCHSHLRHIGTSNQTHEDRTSYVVPLTEIAVVIDKLGSEERRLDQVRGTLYECLAKEIFGDKDYKHSELQRVTKGENTDLKHKLQNVANFLQIAIYVFSRMSHMPQSESLRHMWTCYEPRLQGPLRRNENCRYYVTLFYNHADDEFDIIIPNTGCNCQMLPPLSRLKQDDDPDEGQELITIATEKHHMPLVTFLSDEPTGTLFDADERELPPCPPYSEIRQILKRPDMEHRTVDLIEDHSYSLFRIISKEIFGTEVRVDLILTEICSEIMKEPQIYSSLIHHDCKNTPNFTEMFKSAKTRQEGENMRSATIGVERIEDGLDVGDLELFAAATHFQTVIYVLSVDEDGSSFWNEYLPIRRKRKPYGIQNRQLKARCPDLSKYYITAYRASAGQYHRIVPRTEECNCQLDPPTCPDRVQFPVHGLTRSDMQMLLAAGKTESNFKRVNIALDNWVRVNYLLQLLCDAVIAEIEGRRKTASIVTIFGSGVGLVGAGLVGIGILTAPATGGISLLAVAGGIAGGLGGTVATGAKLGENVLNNRTIKKLERCQNSLKEHSSHLELSIAMLTSSVNNLGEKVTEFMVDQNLETCDNAGLQMIPSLLRTIKGFSVIPLGILRFSFRGATLLGVVIGPLTALIDAGLIVFSAINLYQGSKTDVSLNLRRISAVLRSSRIQMHSWAYGNQIPVQFP